MTEQGDPTKRVGGDFWVELAGVEGAFRGVLPGQDLMLAAAKIGLDHLAAQAHAGDPAQALAKARMALTLIGQSTVKKPDDLIVMHDALIELDPGAWQDQVREAAADIEAAHAEWLQSLRPH